CKKPVSFSVFDLDHDHLITCPKCSQKYGFGEETLKRQLKKFAALCRQIRDSEEILGTSMVAVTVGRDEVKVPFKLLLTRLKSTLDLTIGSKKLSVTFRIEPVTL